MVQKNHPEVGIPFNSGPDTRAVQPYPHPRFEVPIDNTIVHAWVCMVAGCDFTIDDDVPLYERLKLYHEHVQAAGHPFNSQPRLERIAIG